MSNVEAIYVQCAQVGALTLVAFRHFGTRRRISVRLALGLLCSFGDLFRFTTCWCISATYWLGVLIRMVPPLDKKQNKPVLSIK